MDWLREHNGETHEGYPVAVLSTGERAPVLPNAVRAMSSVTSNPERLETLAAAVDDEIARRRILSYDDQRVAEPNYVIDGDIVAWGVACTCGWGGTQLRRTRDADASLRDPPLDIAEQLHDEWLIHLWPMAIAEQIREATVAITQLHQRRAQLASLARSYGLSWSDIGDVAGMTRQSAQERWANPQDVGYVVDAQGNAWPLVAISDLHPGDRVPPEPEELDPHHRWIRFSHYVHHPDGMIEVCFDDKNDEMWVYPGEVWTSAVHPHWL
jgi:hypothetical protein